MARSKIIYNKEQITDISFQIINIEGETALSARRLAKQMNMSAMTLYNYVENIDAIKKEVILKGFNILYRNIYQRLNCLREKNERTSVSSYCKMIAQVLFEFSRENKGVYKLMFSFDKGSFKRDPEIKPFYDFFMQIYRKMNMEKEKSESLKKSFHMFELVMHGLVLEDLEMVSPHTLNEYNEHIDLYITHLIKVRNI